MGRRRGTTWVCAVLAIGTVGNALRLRRRLASLQTLDDGTGAHEEPPPGDGTDDFVTIAAPGVGVAPATTTAAVHFARANDLDAVELVPADLPRRELLRLARVTDPASYRTDPLAAGVSARHAMVLRDDLASRAGIGPPDDLAAFEELSRRVKLYAPRTSDLVLAPPESASALPPADERRLLAADPAAPFTIGWSVARATVLTASVAMSPVWGLAAVAGFCVEPEIATARTRARPRDRSIMEMAGRWLAEPLRWLRIARVPRPDHSEPDPVDARREKYAALIADGTLGFFEDRRTTCPLCGSAELVEALRTTDIYHRKPGTFILDECRSCGHIFQNPRLSPRGLDFYYGDFYDGLGESMSNFAFAQSGDSYAGRVNLVARHASPARWLDVGAGHGHFCLVAADQFPGTAFDGLDLSASIDEAARRRWIDRGVNGLFCDVAPTLAGAYDVVSMHHYLEHTIDPLAELEAARVALRPQGLLLIEVPDPECRFGRWLGPAWVPWFQPQHLHFLSAANLSRSLEARGFEIVEVERGEVHQPVDLAGAAIFPALKYAPAPRLPWLDPPDLPRRAGRVASFAAVAPLAAAATLIDRAVVPPLAKRVEGLSNAYRVLARAV